LKSVVVSSSRVNKNTNKENNMNNHERNIIANLKKEDNLKAFLKTFFTVEELTELLRDRVKEYLTSAASIETRLGFEGFDNGSVALANFCNDCIEEVYVEVVPEQDRFEGWDTFYKVWH
jgi:hypothetical protein